MNYLGSNVNLHIFFILFFINHSHIIRPKYRFASLAGFVHNFFFLLEFLFISEETINMNKSHAIFFEDKKLLLPINTL